MASKSSPSATKLGRRGYLASLAGVGAASFAGCSFFEGGADSSTTALEGERARKLAERFAPTFYFDEYEQWYPTDPRPYETESDGQPIVNGFEALNGYHERFDDSTAPPEPTVFYNAVEYDDSPLAVVQFWQYSVFDQFSTNFHWHDWEVLHVYVDTETDEPLLHVASSHSRSVPNNEFLDPAPGRIPAILVELGSHSNALSINDRRQRFQRLPFDGGIADITNGSFDIEAIAELPIAYGLPRDEGSRLPFARPELDGGPIYEHQRLPSVEQTDLIDESLVFRSFSELLSPPSDLPSRNTGLIFEHVGRDVPEADVKYDLVPTSELEHIQEFTGPQLSFEFAIPEFVEDAMSGHITTTGVPWHSPRYDNPASDITDDNHRRELSQRYDAIGEPAPSSTVVASITQAVTDDDAPTNEGVTTESSTIEGIALLESEPEAVPTFAGGVTVLQGVPEDDHRLTVNGAGLAPYSNEISVGGDDELTPAGVEGEIPLVANEDATRLEIDPRDADSELTEFSVEDDFAGRLYDSDLSKPDALYVHRGGAYTTEIRDADGEVGAVRVNPQTEESVTIDDPQTGKASLATFLADISEGTAATVARATDGETDDTANGSKPADTDGSGNAIQGLQQALAAVAESARRAAERAEAGDGPNADAALDGVSTRLERATNRLADARDSLPDEVSRGAERRLDQAQQRAEQAKQAEKL